MHHGISLPCLHVTSKSGSAVFCCDIRLECDDIWHRLHWNNIHTNDEGVDGTKVGGNLTPGTWGSTKIDHHLGLLEEMTILFIDLDDFERGTGSVTLD